MYQISQISEVSDFASPLFLIPRVPSCARVIGLEWLKVKDQREEENNADGKPLISLISLIVAADDSQPGVVQALRLSAALCVRLLLEFRPMPTKYHINGSSLDIGECG